MQKITLLILLAFSGSCLNAQTNLDSLYTIWQDKTQPDSNRLKALDDYIWFGYVYSNPDKALVLSDTLFEFSKKSGKKKVMASALNMKGLAFYNKGDYLKAIHDHEGSLKIQNEIGNDYGAATSLNNIGMTYQSQGNYINGLKYYQESLKKYKEIGNNYGIALVLGNIGNIYNSLSDFINAMDYQQKSLVIREKIGDKRGIANTLNNVGIIHSQQGDYLKALDYYQRSLKIRESIGDQMGIATSLKNISGIIYYNQSNYIDALDYQKRSLKIFQEMGSKDQMANSLNQIGTIYFEQRYYNKAIDNCKKGLRISEELNDIIEQNKSCECLYNTYKALGNGNKALVYHEQMLVLNDSLKTEETAKKLQRMEFTKLVLADSLVQVQKNLKVEMAHQTEVRKKDKNKNIALGAGIFFLLLAGGFYSRWRYVKKSKTVIEKEKDRSDNLLLNILPAEIAEELKEKGSADARDFDLVSILFSDFKGFTQVSEKLSAKELIAEINHCFMAFDHICEKHGIEKIKTIGDAYMAAGGLPVPSKDSIKNTVLAALDMQSFISNLIIEKDELNEMSFKMRLGIHTGPVVAGIVGVKKFQYDIWGDTVNTASRMESSGEIGKVNISEGTYALLKDDPEFNFESRGKIEAKGKGEMEMYFVETN
jgi:class 3 adenylate cyclase/Tfp pilus assembly protein PilF